MNEQLRATRLEKGWSQEEAAAAVGVAPRTYQRWEHGGTIPNFVSRRMLRQVFEASDEMLGVAPRKKDAGQPDQQTQETMTCSSCERKRMISFSLEAGIWTMFVKQISQKKGSLYDHPCKFFLSISRNASHSSKDQGMGCLRNHSPKDAHFLIFLHRLLFSLVHFMPNSINERGDIWNWPLPGRVYWSFGDETTTLSNVIVM